MKRFRIRSRQWPALSSASRSTIEGYFVSRQAPAREQRWLDDNNRYRLKCTSKFEGDFARAAGNRRPLSKEKCRFLTAYIGASGPAHLIDGWSFLGRAVDAALRGDTYSAAHFAYYAELRAAMGLLGSEAIGIFNQVHPIVTRNGIQSFPDGRKGTHAVVWPILKFWSSLNRASELLDYVVRPEQIPLSNWLTEIAPNLSPRALGQRWLNSWGLDLENIEEDHDTRNQVSYRPSEFRPTQPTGAKNLISFVKALWSLFEPGQGGRFPVMEKFLLRNAWRKARIPGINANSVQNLGVGAAEAARWVLFLNEVVDPAPIAFAESSTQIEDSNCHLRIISRAALLLFVASGSTRRHLQSAGYTSKTIGFWWTRYGTERGIWPVGGSPADPLDSWEDVNLVLGDLSVWEAENAALVPSITQMRRHPRINLSELGAFERAGIWCLMP